MDNNDDNSKQIQKVPQYSIEELKKNTRLLQRGLEDLGIVLRCCLTCTFAVLGLKWWLALKM